MNCRVQRPVWRLGSRVLLCLLLGVSAQLYAQTDDLLPIPSPELSQFEKGVRDALTQAQSAVSAHSESDDPLKRAIDYGQLGMLYQAYDMPAQAEPCYLNAQRLAPGHYQWPYLLAYQYQLNGRLDKAAEYYRLALEIEPENLPGLLHLGQALNKLDRLDDASQVFKKALSIAPDHAAALEGLAEISFRRKDDTQTIRYLEKALSIDPGADRLHYQLGMAYRRAGNSDLARQHLAKRGKGSPVIQDPAVAALDALLKTSQVYIKDGVAAYEAGNFAQAALNYEQALASDPDDEQTRLALAWALELSGDEQAALAHLDTILARSPQAAKAHYLKGALLAEKGQLQEARDHLQTAVLAVPDAFPPRLILATVLMNLGQYKEAASHYAQLAQRQSDDEVLLYRLGVARLAAGECTLAVEPLENALRMRSGSLTLMQALLRSYSLCPEAGQSNAQTALTQSQRLFDSSRRWDTAETLAMALAANARFEEAHSLQQEVIKQAQANGLPENTLAGLRHNQNRYQRKMIADQAWPDGDAVLRPAMVSKQQRLSLEK